FDLLVADLDPELVGRGLEHELSRDRLARLGANALLELLRRAASQLEVHLRGDPPPFERAEQAREQLARATLDERPVGVDVGGLDERVDSRRPEGALRGVLRLLAQARLDLAAELVERLELARGAREVVVERRQHLLLDL